MEPKTVQSIVGFTRRAHGIRRATRSFTKRVLEIHKGTQSSNQENSSTTNLPNEQGTDHQPQDMADLPQSQPISRNFAPLEILPTEIAWSICQHLDLKSIKRLQRTSPKLLRTIEAYKAHCCSTIRAQYATEDSLFGSRLQQGWMITTKEIYLKGIQQATRPLEGPDYFQFLRSYSANLRHLQRFILLVCRDKGLYLDPDPLYQAILVWSLYGWTPISQRRLEVLPESGQGGGCTPLAITELPASMLQYFHRPAR